MDVPHLLAESGAYIHKWIGKPHMSLLTVSSLRGPGLCKSVGSQFVALLTPRMTVNQEFAFRAHICVFTAEGRFRSVSFTEVHTRTPGFKCRVKCRHSRFCCPLYVLCELKLQHVANTFCTRQMTDRQMWHSHSSPLLSRCRELYDP